GVRGTRRTHESLSFLLTAGYAERGDDNRGRQRSSCRPCRRDFRATSPSAFSGYRWPADVSLTAVRWYASYPLSAASRGVARCGGTGRGVSVLFLKWNTLTKRALGGELLTWRFQKSFPRIFSAISSRASLSVLPRKSLNLLGVTAATV